MENAQEIGEVFAFDALGDGAQAEAVGHLDDRAHDRCILGVARQIAHKRLINFQLVYLETLQISEARITGAEIID